MVRWPDSSIARWCNEKNIIPPRPPLLKGGRGGIIILVLLAMTTQVAYAAEWQQVADGIQYKKIILGHETIEERSTAPGIIHAFQIDTLKNKLAVITAKQIGSINSYIKPLAKKTGALIAINGGFFSPEYESLGLIVQNGQEINKLKWTSWWHIFQMRRFKPQIITKQEYNLIPDIEMAIESGPRLLIDGKMPQLKPSIAERSAIGISQDGKVILASTEGALLSLSDFAENLKKIGCYDALNLDGGSSTQIYAKFKRFELERQGLGFITNGIGVFVR